MNAPSQGGGGQTPTGPLGNLARLRLSQNYLGAVQAKKVLNTVPVRKPSKQEFVRTSRIIRFETTTYRWDEDGRTFLVDPGVFDKFGEGLRPTRLIGTVNRQGVFYFWPICLPGPDGDWNIWHRSADAAAVAAEESWVRVASNRTLGAYDQFVARGELPPPEWPDLSVDQLLELAFQDAFIRSPDHVVLKKLRGEL